MKSTRRQPRPLSERRASDRHRTGARRAARSFESLETRLLLSETAQVLKPVVVIETTDRKVVEESPAPAPARHQSQKVTGPLSVATSPERDDAFTLPSGEGEPTVLVDLLWPEGSDPSDGHLLVSDAKGKVFYDLPLTGVQMLHAELPMPAGRGASPTLDVDLAIHRASAGSDSSGSYQVAIYWGQSSKAAFSDFTPGSAPPATLPAAPTDLLAAAYPSLTATRNLPLSASTSDTFSQSGGRIGAGDPSSFIGPPSSPKMSGVPAGPMTGPLATTPTSGSSTTSTPSPAPTSSPAVPIQVPGEGSKPSSGEAGQGSRPAVVGPLPLNGSSPDGGIFAFPNGPSRGSNDPFQETFTTTPAPPEDGTMEPSHDRPAPRSARFAWPIPTGPRAVRSSFASPFVQELEAAAPSTGIAYLPPIEGLAGNRPARASSQVKPSKSHEVRTSLADETRPRASLGATLLGSASLLLGLFAPGGIDRLTSWQDDRRWVRRALDGTPKKPSIIPPEV